MTAPPGRSFALLALVAAVAACGSRAEPVSSTNAADTAATGASADTSAPADTSPPPRNKLDVLWVIDQSASFCQEQRHLALALDALLQGLSTIADLDVQMAATTIQQVQDKAEVVIPGRFGRRYATKFPPNCTERRKMHCANSGHCSAATSSTCARPPVCRTACGNSVRGSLPRWGRCAERRNPGPPCRYWL